jgi:hypothetical protein
MLPSNLRYSFLANKVLGPFNHPATDFITRALRGYLLFHVTLDLPSKALIFALGLRQRTCQCNQ